MLDGEFRDQLRRAAANRDGDPGLADDVAANASRGYGE